MSIPSALTYSVNSFPISRQGYKILPYSLSTANPGDTIQISLPMNTIVDLGTLSVFGTVSTSATGTTPGALLPQNIESLIDSVFFTVNGVQISNTYSYYNLLTSIFLDMQGEDKRSLRKVLQNSAPVPTPTISTVVTNQPFEWHTWLGLPGTATTRMIDSSLLGDVRINIRLAPSTVLATINATSATYQVNGLYGVIDCVSVDDGGVYHSLIAKKLESGPLQINYKDYYSFSLGPQPASFAGRFSVNTQSLDAIHCTLQPWSQANLAPAAVAGYDSAASNSSYFTRGVQSSAGFTNSLVTLNNIMYPSWGATTLAETFSQTCKAFNEHTNMVGTVNPGIKDLTTFGQEYFVASTRFNSPGWNGIESATRSGVDTRGSAAFASWTLSATGSNNPIVFCETTKTLSIGAGRQIQVTA